MKVIRKSFKNLSEKEKYEIDLFINENNGLIFHETSFNEIANSTFHSELTYFLAYVKAKLVGICPAHSTSKGILDFTFSNNGSYEIPYGGWVYDPEKISFSELWKHMPVGTMESLLYWSSFTNDIQNDVRIRGQQFKTGIINLNLTEDELYTNTIHSKRRNMIRKAEKTGIIVHKYAKDGLSIYYKLMLEMHKKTGLTDIPYEYYENIIDYYGPLNKAIIMIAFFEENPISGLFLVGNKNVIHYWQGASEHNVPNMGQGELLQWEAIKWAKKQGAKYYDLCVIEPKRLPHIAQFKMGFTKEFVSFYCLNRKNFLFKIMNKFQNVFTN